MITIYIDPLETESSDACDARKVVEQEPCEKRSDTRYIVVIALLICVIIIALITACSSGQAYCLY